MRVIRGAEKRLVSLEYEGHDGSMGGEAEVTESWEGRGRVGKRDSGR